MCIRDSHYIVLHIGINTGSGTDGYATISHVSLSTNPAISNLVQGEGGDEADAFIDLEDVTIRRGAGMAWAAKGINDRDFLDGSMRRTSIMRDQLRASFSANFHKVDEQAYQKLMTLWALSTQGLGGVVPGPVPLVVDFGLGQLPHFGYYHIASGTFAGGFNPSWTLAEQGYDIGLQFREV
jgi:hypothetical protein